MYAQSNRKSLNKQTNPFLCFLFSSLLVTNIVKPKNKFGVRIDTMSDYTVCHTHIENSQEYMKINVGLQTDFKGCFTALQCGV